jgi:dihydroorotase
MVDTGLLDWADVARVMSRTPARIGRLAGHGRPLAAGEPAELTLYDAGASAVFDDADLRGRSHNSPYRGRALPGSVRWTIHAGRVTVADGATIEVRG